MEGTRQTSTSCTGRTAYSLAYIWSEAWHWWQSQYRPSVQNRIKNTLIPFYTAWKSKVMYASHVWEDQMIAAPHSFPGCTLTWPCLPVPERWWWSKPQRYWQRRRGKPQSRPHKRWMSPCGSLGLDPGLRKWHPQSAWGPWNTGMH